MCRTVRLGVLQNNTFRGKGIKYDQIFLFKKRLHPYFRKRHFGEVGTIILFRVYQDKQATQRHTKLNCLNTSEFIDSKIVTSVRKIEGFHNSDIYLDNVFC